MIDKFVYLAPRRTPVKSYSGLEERNGCLRPSRVYGMNSRHVWSFGISDTLHCTADGWCDRNATPRKWKRKAFLTALDSIIYEKRTLAGYHQWRVFLFFCAVS